MRQEAAMPLLAVLLVATAPPPPVRTSAEVRVLIISGASITARSWRPAVTPHQRVTRDQLTGGPLRLTEYE